MGKWKSGNIYSKVPHPKDHEIFEMLVADRKFKIERIVSQGQATPQGEWLSQAHDEWVMVLKGAGRLKFRRGKRPITLKAGDYIFIPANTFHRVEWTSARVKTIWLAVHAGR